MKKEFQVYTIATNLIKPLKKVDFQICSNLNSSHGYSQRNQNYINQYVSSIPKHNETPLWCTTCCSWLFKQDLKTSPSFTLNRSNTYTDEGSGQSLFSLWKYTRCYSRNPQMVVCPALTAQQNMHIQLEKEACRNFIQSQSQFQTQVQIQFQIRRSRSSSSPKSRSRSRSRWLLICLSFSC